MRSAESALLQAHAAERAALLASFEKEREAFAAERAQWAEERKTLLNAALTHSTAEFAARQQAAKPARPQPISSVPEEAREARPRMIGL